MRNFAELRGVWPLISEHPASTRRQPPARDFFSFPPAPPPPRFSSPPPIAPADVARRGRGKHCRGPLGALAADAANIGAEGAKRLPLTRQTLARRGEGARAVDANRYRQPISRLAHAIRLFLPRCQPTGGRHVSCARSTLAQTLPWKC